MSGVVNVRAWAARALLSALLGARPAMAEAAPPAVGKTLSTRLANGLEVVLSEAREQPVFAMRVSYRVGHRHDPPDLDELAHLAEHLSFRYSGRDGHAQAQALTSAGVEFNAYTADDETCYLNEGPIGTLDLVLWLERQRMAFTLPTLTSADVVDERRMLDNEHATMRADRLGGMFWNLVEAELFSPGHPYAPREERGCILRCRLQHVQWLMQRGYRPDNARLVLVGDFDAGLLLTRVTRLFGSIQSSTVSLPAKAPPPLRAERRSITIAAPVRRSELKLYWRVPEALRARRSTLQVLRSELERRLDRDLVQEVGSATNVEVSIEQRELGWLFSVEVELFSGAEPKDVERRVLSLLAQLHDKVMPIESGRASSVNNLFATWDSPRGRAELLSHGTFGFDVAKEARDISRVSAGDVQLVAKQFLLGPPRLTVYVRRAVDASFRGELYREPR